IRQGQAEAIPLLREIEGQPLTWPVGGSNACLVQTASVVRTQALEEVKDPAAILGRAIFQLVSRPAIQARRNNNVFVDVTRRDDSLRKHIDNVVIGVSPTMEFSDERS